MKTKFFLLFIIILMSCNSQPTKRSCGFNFFEKTSNVSFPNNVEIIDCYDDTEGDIWVHLKFSEEEVESFMNKLNFHSYSSNSRKLEEDKNESISYVSSDKDAIETFKTYMGEKYVTIPRTELTYIKIIQKEKQYVTYAINKKSGLFWGHISYPDWSGDYQLN